MAILYRTDGAWGTGKGVNLTPVEVDENFYDVDSRITFVEENPPEAVVPIAINIEGSLFTMDLSDGTTLGPIVMTMPVPQWRGEWQPNTDYNEMDFFTAPDGGGFGAVMLTHRSAATFDWGALDPDTSRPLYQVLVGGSGTTSGLSDLVDVALAAQAANDMLVWDAAASLWRNKTPAAVATILPAFGGSTPAAAGLKGLVPPPAAGDAAAGKVLGAGGGWIVPAGGSGGSTSLAGLSDVAIVSPVNLSLLQYSTTDGKWHNQTLATLGAGTVTHIDTGGGLVGGPITSTGSIALAPVADKALLANVTGSSAAPAGISLSTLLDAVIGTDRGAILRRGGTGWTAILPGIDGQFLRTGGPGADVTWGTPSGAGTVTQVNSGTGLTGGPITATGTLSLATVTDNQVLANITGATAAPVGTTFTTLLDHALGATQGMILYRGASAWTALPAGASGAVLTSGGAAANPSWVTGSGAGTVTQVNTGTGLIGGPITGVGTVSFATIAANTLLANISGSTAAPTASTMSAIMDAVFSATRGTLLYRGAGGWAALAPGTAGQMLATGGTGADPTWAAAGGASIKTGATPPTSPAPVNGDAWWDSSDGGGQLYIYYTDANSSAWVPAVNQPGPIGPPGPTGATGATGPAGSANMTGMTAGQIPIAAGATSVTSSANLSGDVTSNSALAVTLATVNSNVGTFQGLTVDGKGRVTAAVNQGYLTSATAASTYAPLASPNFTGTVTTPSLALATGLFANSAVGSNYIYEPSAAHNQAIIVGASDGSVTTYIRNNTVLFQTVGGSALLTTINTGGLTVGAGLNGYKPGGGVWADSSDMRLKQNVAEYKTGLNAVLALRPVSFEFNGKGGTVADGKTYVGLIAQEAKEVMPEMVSVRATPPVAEEPGKPAAVPELTEILTLEATALIYALVNCSKELVDRIDTLHARLKALEEASAAP